MENNEGNVKEALFNTISELYKEYHLPEQSISDKEWQALLYVLESHFLAHNMINDYQHALNIIVRRGLYYAQVNGNKEFNITHLKRALTDLSAFNIPSDEIKAIEEELDERLNKQYVK